MSKHTAWYTPGMECLSLTAETFTHKTGAHHAQTDRR